MTQYPEISNSQFREYYQRTEPKFGCSDISSFYQTLMDLGVDFNFSESYLPLENLGLRTTLESKIETKVGKINGSGVSIFSSRSSGHNHIIYLRSKIPIEEINDRAEIERIKKFLIMQGFILGRDKK